MYPLLSRPVQRAWRNLPVCPVGTRGRILKRRVSYSNHAAAMAQASGAAGEGRKGIRDIIPIMPRRNPALSWALPSPPSPPPIPPSAAGSTTPSDGLTTTAYFYPNHSPPAISRLLRAIDSRSPEAIWHHFSLLTSSERARLSPQHLSHILLSLRPKKHLPLASRAYLDHYHPSYSPSLSSIPLARLPKRQHAINWLMSRVAAVLAEYRANNVPLGSAEYAHLLDLARAKEDVRMAREVWAEMDARGVAKDTKCYNTYIAALCGSLLSEGTWKTNARTVEVRARRDWGVREREAQGKVGDVGVVALRVWEAMLKDGCVPDVATFEFVLGAVARMGNLPVVKALVWRAWGVDISAPSFDTPPTRTKIQETEPDLSTSTKKAKPSPPGQFTPNHPPPPPQARSASEPPPLHLRPTPQTLTNLATTISRLSHPSLAIRLINHLSLTYDLTIPTSTWQHLLVWTYVYTRPPARTRVLPESAMTGLWQVMRAPPYNVEPEIEMYDLIIRHHLRGQRYKWAKQLITEALSPGEAWDQLIKQFEATRRRVEREVGWGVNRSRAAQDRRKGLPQLHQTTPLTTKLAALDLRIWRARSLASRWIQLLIYAPGVEDTVDKEFRRREIPKLVNRYAAEFLPGQVGYKIEGSGYVTVRAGEGVLGIDPPKPYQWPTEPRRELEVVRVSEEQWMQEEEGVE
ncbi:hypothetical protein EV426DRAFT_62010 [Tirmania nivea]|nr:hypothetical protein EV426DRAFT_62010 [Tirmania nivea]